jgi:catechol 2,3-dioxygenase-like lactoylglutathione lyase family enzyme
MVNRTEDEAVRFYQEYLGLEKIRDFVVGQELAMQLFSLSQEIKVLVFGKDDVKIEIFIIPDYTPPSPRIGHFCLYIDRFSELIERSKVSGVTVIRGSHQDKTVYFLKDFSDNMIEIKPT